MDERPDNTDFMSSAIVSSAAGFPISVQEDHEGSGRARFPYGLVRRFLALISRGMSRSRPAVSGQILSR